MRTLIKKFGFGLVLAALLLSLFAPAAALADEGIPNIIPPPPAEPPPAQGG